LKKKIIVTLVFEKNANFFRQKLAKIAENCDHNIDPWSRCFYHLMQEFTVVQVNFLFFIARYHDCCDALFLPEKK
jgi:hypothetical protein